MEIWIGSRQLLCAQSDLSQVTGIVGIVIFVALGAVALWGAFCLVLVWMRVTRQRFSSETDQGQFLGRVEQLLASRDFDAVAALCQDDARTLSQLVLLGVRNRRMGYSAARQLVIDRFQRDVLADLDYRLSWVQTVIKSAPMLGLLGTVLGMMGAFGKISNDDSVSANILAEDISLALTTTACGLAIAIPLVLASNSVRVRIRKMEDLIENGLARLFIALRSAL